MICRSRSRDCGFAFDIFPAPQAGCSHHSSLMTSMSRLTLWAGLGLCLVHTAVASPRQPRPWMVGQPIVTYWCGPAMTDATAKQMAEGGFNLVWCGENELDVAKRHGLRAQLQDGLLSPATLIDPVRLAKLDALVERVKNHPALYAYFITDEPAAGQFADLGRLVAYLRKKDPAHLAYINLFPTYATNEQLGNRGDVVTAYREHLRQFVDVVKPDLISYDHYQFTLKGDMKQYFLNLSLIREEAMAARLPFLNIVQASTWAPEQMRVPNVDELRYLVYTTAAYGAQGLSYYIYTCPNHLGGFALADGTPTPLYHAARNYNREFVALANELKSLRSLAVHHTSFREQGCQALPADAVFRANPLPGMELPRGFLIGTFGRRDKPTHALVVNMDYQKSATVVCQGPGRLSLFDAPSASWAKVDANAVTATLAPGGGLLLRAGR